MCPYVRGLWRAGDEQSSPTIVGTAAAWSQESSGLNGFSELPSYWLVGLSKILVAWYDKQDPWL